VRGKGVPIVPKKIKPLKIIPVASGPNFCTVRVRVPVTFGPIKPPAKKTKKPSGA
jgi:hypothetical protein